MVYFIGDFINPKFKEILTQVSSAAAAGLGTDDTSPQDGQHTAQSDELPTASQQWSSPPPVGGRRRRLRIPFAFRHGRRTPYNKKVRGVRSEDEDRREGAISCIDVGHQR